MRSRYYLPFLAQQQLLVDTAAIAGVTNPVDAPDGTSTPRPATLEQQIAAAKAEVLGPDTPEAAGLPQDLAGVRALLRTMLGQAQVPMGAWPMSMNRSATRLNQLEPQVAQLVPQVQSALLSIDTLRGVMQQGFADVATTFSLLDAQRQLVLAAVQVERSRNDLQDRKDELQDAAIAQLAAADKLTAALDTLQSAQIEQGRLDRLAAAARQDAADKKQAATDLDLALLKANDATQAAQLLAQASGIESDRQLAVAAQATADQAKADAKVAKELAQTAKDRADLAEADAQAAKTAAGNAQASANTANAGVTAANLRIDGVVASVATVSAAATAAQTTADQAKAAVAALGDKGRVLLGVATPASVGLLSIGGTITVPLKWDKAFGNIDYTGAFVRTSGGAANMSVRFLNKTTTSCTLELTLNGTVALAVPAGAGDVVLTHS